MVLIWVLSQCHFNMCKAARPLEFAYHERQAERAHSQVPGQVLLFTLRKMSSEVPKAAAKQTTKGDSPATGVEQTDHEGQQAISDMSGMCWAVRSVNLIQKEERETGKHMV
jgi:hypothetical protein